MERCHPTAHRLYPVEYEYGRLGKATGLAAAVLFASQYLNMFVTNVWATTVLKLFMLALFPIGLMVLRVFSTNEVLRGRLWLLRVSGRYPSPSG